TTYVMTAASYADLADNPVLFCPPNEVSFDVGNTKIVIAVYSETGKVFATDLLPHSRPICESMETFFAQLPVNQYHFLFHFAPSSSVAKVKGKGLNSGFVALEHNYSSVYYLEETDNPYYLRYMVQDICAHEFLHILTSSMIHSHEIGNFNFRNPEMSKHLWMYEGVTEYFAHLAMLQS